MYNLSLSGPIGINRYSLLCRRTYCQTGSLFIDSMPTKKAEFGFWGNKLLCDTTPRRASVATNGLWRVAARAWHEPPADACSVVSAHPSHLDR